MAAIDQAELEYDVPISLVVPSLEELVIVGIALTVARPVSRTVLTNQGMSVRKEGTTHVPIVS